MEVVDDDEVRFLGGGSCMKTKQVKRQYGVMSYILLPRARTMSE